jgi:hypothetical protein
MTLTIERTLAALVALVLLAVAIPAFAAEPNWELNDNTAIVFTCGGGEYPHTLLNVSQDEDGTLTGNGWYHPDHSYTWDLTGDIDGDNITYTITYTGAAAGSVYTNTGVIALDGSISGTSTGNCQTFASPADTATEIEDEPEVTVPTSKDQCKKDGWMTLTDSEGNAFKNQGQCVSFVASAK